MGKRKETKEERDKRIEEIVRKKIEAERVVKRHKSKLEFVEEAFGIAIKKFKYEDLPWRYMLDTAKYLINDEEFSENEKTTLRCMFSDDFIYFGGRGFKPEDKEAIDNTRRAIIAVLEE